MPTCRAPPTLLSNYQTSVDPPRLFPPRPMVSTTCGCLFGIPRRPFVHSCVSRPPIYTPLSLTIVIPPGTTLKGGWAVLRSSTEVREDILGHEVISCPWHKRLHLNTTNLLQRVTARSQQGHYQLNHLPPLALLTKPAGILPRSRQVETFGAPGCRRHPGRYSQTPARFGSNALPGTGYLQLSEHEPTCPCGCLSFAFGYASGLSCHSVSLMASIDMVYGDLRGASNCLKVHRATASKSPVGANK